MRDPIEIEREMAETQQDLEDNLAALRRALRAKVDLPARARVAIARRWDGARRLARSQPLAAIALMAFAVYLLARVARRRSAITSR